LTATGIPARAGSFSPLAIFSSIADAWLSASSSVRHMKAPTSFCLMSAKNFFRAYLFGFQELSKLFDSFAN
jgi:hypothetical protein